MAASDPPRYTRDSTIRLSVEYCTNYAGIRIHAQVYDPKTNTPMYEIGTWELAEFSKIAPSLLRAYQAGRWSATNITVDTSKAPI